LIIQIIGLPGSGKTSLATEICSRINAVHINADYVRATINSDLGFSIKDRVEHARRLGEMARMLSGQGLSVVVDFICPTESTRNSFGKPDHLIWVNRIKEGRFSDTNAMWEDPSNYDINIQQGLTIKEEVDLVISTLKLHDWKAPTTLMLGRYQPWHEGHHALYNEALKRTSQVVLGVRNTGGTSEKDPLSFNEVKKYIEKDKYMRGVMIVNMPNITNIVYGRDVGYKIEQVDLGAEIHAISATQKRKEMGI
jgi:hypothetical protein